MSTFEVGIWEERGYKVTIEAENAEAAEELALARFDEEGTDGFKHCNCVHGDTGIACCEEVKGDK